MLPELCRDVVDDDVVKYVNTDAGRGDEDGRQCYHYQL